MCVHQKVVCTIHSSDTYTTCLSEKFFFFNLFHVCFLHLYDFETLKKKDTKAPSWKEIRIS